MWLRTKYWGAKALVPGDDQAAVETHPRGIHVLAKPVYRRVPVLDGIIVLGFG